MHWDDWHMGGWMMGLWWILILTAIGAVIWFALAVSRASGDKDESPEQALKRRYASGEIDRDTYQQMLEDLRK